MTAVDWSGYPEPFRDIGIEFAEMLPALCGDVISPFLQRHFPGGFIREQRKRLRLSQRELARLVGTTQSRISDYELGESRPPPAMREQLAAILLPESPP